MSHDEDQVLGSTGIYRINLEAPTPSSSSGGLDVASNLMVNKVK
jgi:hypothetical protein